MGRFVVEVIRAGKTERRETIEASTPVSAATIIAGCQVTFRRSEETWIKVTASDKHRTFQFVKA